MNEIEITNGALSVKTATRGNSIELGEEVKGYYASADTTKKLTIHSSDEVPLFFGIEGKLFGAAKIGFEEIQTKSLLGSLRASLVAYGLNAKDIKATIGPCLTFSHCPVERKVIEKLLSDGYQAAAKRTDGVDFLDLPVFVLLELRRLGVEMENIKIGDYDTFENPDLLYSKLRGEKEENPSTASLS